MRIQPYGNTVSDKGTSRPTTSSPEAAPAGSKSLSLRHNFAWTTAGNVTYSVSSWLMLTVIAKLGTPEMVGLFALGLAVTQPVLFLTALNLSTLQATDVQQRYRFSDYFALRLLTNAVALGLTALVCLLGHYGRAATGVILITACGAVFDAVSDIVYGLLRQHERMDRIAISMGLKGPLSLLGVGLGILMTHSVLWAAFGSAIASALVLLAYDLPGAVRRLGTRDAELSCRWDAGILSRLAWLSLPMGFVMMLVALNNNVPRYFVEHYLGSHQLGIFSAMASFVAVGRIIVTALGMSATPRLARYYAGKEYASFKSLAFRMLGLGAAVGGAAPLLAWAFGKPLLSALFKPEYAQHVDALTILLLAGGILYVSMFLGSIMTAARYFKVQVPYLIAVTATAIISGYVLIPRHGLLGAAVATLLAVLVQAGGGFVIFAFVLRNLRRGDDLRS